MKLKLNWVQSIILSFVLFISFILYFIFTTLTNPKYDHKLVSEEYYNEELKYQELIDSQQNYNTLGEYIEFSQSSEGIKLIFTGFFADKTLKGTVKLYRPSNGALDKSFDLILSDDLVFDIASGNLVGGKWLVNIDFILEGKRYTKIETIYYK
ncbi:MAG: FixH family protein [Flavobacteriaceae bacterium]|nr:FixH family protein [Flavobacteriaceae bacterium]